MKKNIVQKNNDIKSHSPTSKEKKINSLESSSDDESIDIDDIKQTNNIDSISESSDDEPDKDSNKPKSEESSDDEEKKAKKEEEALKNELFSSLPPNCKAFIPSDLTYQKKPQTPNRETTPEECFLECPKIISRAEWGATKPKKELDQNVVRVRPAIFLETDASNCESKSDCTQVVKLMQRLQMDLLKFNDIAFSFLISEDGTIYEGRGWGYVNEKAEGFAAIGYIGYHSLEPLEEPNEAMMKATYDLIMCGVRKGFLYNPFATGAFSGETPLELVRELMEQQEDVDYRSRPEDFGID